LGHGIPIKRAVEILGSKRKYKKLYKRCCPEKKGGYAELVEKKGRLFIRSKSEMKNPTEFMELQKIRESKKRDDYSSILSLVFGSILFAIGLLPNFKWWQKLVIAIIDEIIFYYIRPKSMHFLMKITELKRFTS